MVSVRQEATEEISYNMEMEHSSNLRLLLLLLLPLSEDVSGYKRGSLLCLWTAAVATTKGERVKESHNNIQGCCETKLVECAINKKEENWSAIPPFLFQAHPNGNPPLSMCMCVSSWVARENFCCDGEGCWRLYWPERFPWQLRRKEDRFWRFYGSVDWDGDEWLGREEKDK